MALHIRNPEADRLARELAARTGETLTEAVVHSLEERLRRIRKPDAQMVAELMEIAARSAALPVLNDLTDDEILGYGPNGYPE